MKRAKRPGIRFLVWGAVLLSFVCGSPCAAEERYPLKIERIERSEATYNTPENTLAAICSASENGDIHWISECLTAESIERMRLLAKEAEVSLGGVFQPIETCTGENYIVDKKQYKGTTLLLTELRIPGEYVLTIPSAFVLVDGKWKRTDRFENEKEFQKFYNYVNIEHPLGARAGQREIDGWECGRK